MTKVLIIGGGIAGLTCAKALEIQGIEVTLCEQAEHFSDVGAGITLWPNALIALRGIDEELEKSVISAGFEYHGGAIRDYKGKILKKQDLGNYFAQLDSNAIGIHRAKLITELRNSLKNTTIFTNKKCLRVEQSDQNVKAYFNDDSSILANILIGADGINSIIRKSIHPNLEKRYSGYGAWRGIVHISKEFGRDISTKLGESWGYGNRFGYVLISEEMVYFFATENNSEGTRKPENEKEYLKSIFSQWHYPIPDLIDKCNEDELLYNDIYDLKPFNTWHNERIILIGDAAHATTPNMGQGGCISIEDSFELGKIIASQLNENNKEILNLEKIFHMFEEARKKRTDYIQKTSWQIGKIGQWQRKYSVFVRNKVLRLIPNRIMLSQLKKAITPPKNSI